MGTKIPTFENWYHWRIDYTHSHQAGIARLCPRYHHIAWHSAFLILPQCRKTMLSRLSIENKGYDLGPSLEVMHGRI